VTSYVIYQADVHDAARYEDYKKEAAPSVRAAGGRYLVRGSEPLLLEGELPASRTVVLEFPSRQAAVAWYEGEDYTAIRALRHGAADATVYVVDGYGGEG
jgi:uncharacterized protein (DUF1330 family)